MEWSPVLVEESVDALLRGWVVSAAAAPTERGTS